VKYVYYGILSVYAVWGSIVILAGISPLRIATIGSVLQGLSLGVAALHTLHVNRTLLPREFATELVHAAWPGVLWHGFLGDQCYCGGDSGLHLAFRIA